MGRRYLAWHAVKPHAGKDFPSLEAFMGVKGAKSRDRPALDTNTAMRRWVAVMAAANAQTKKSPRKT